MAQEEVECSHPTQFITVSASFSYAMFLTSILNWMVRQSTETETCMNSVERVISMSSVEQEAPAVIDSNRPPENWPSQGEEGILMAAFMHGWFTAVPPQWPACGCCLYGMGSRRN